MQNCSFLDYWTIGCFFVNSINQYGQEDVQELPNSELKVCFNECRFKTIQLLQQLFIYIQIYNDVQTRTVTNTVPVMYIKHCYR